mgnify:CR=1 FL=1
MISYDIFELFIGVFLILLMFALMGMVVGFGIAMFALLTLLLLMALIFLILYFLNRIIIGGKNVK